MSFTLTAYEYYKMTSFNNTSSPLLSLNTNKHTYIPWMMDCVAKTVGCGPIHKYTNIHNVYSVKYYKNFTKRYYRLSFHIKNHLQRTRSVYLGIFLRFLETLPSHA